MGTAKQDRNLQQAINNFFAKDVQEVSSEKSTANYANILWSFAILFRQYPADQAFLLQQAIADENFINIIKNVRKKEVNIDHYIASCEFLLTIIDLSMDTEKENEKLIRAVFPSNISSPEQEEKQGILLACNALKYGKNDQALQELEEAFQDGPSALQSIHSLHNEMQKEGHICEILNPLMQFLFKLKVDFNEAADESASSVGPLSLNQHPRAITLSRIWQQAKPEMIKLFERAAMLAVLSVISLAIGGSLGGLAILGVVTAVLTPLAASLLYVGVVGVGLAGLFFVASPLLTMIAETINAIKERFSPPMGISLETKTPQNSDNCIERLKEKFKKFLRGNTHVTDEGAEPLLNVVDWRDAPSAHNAGTSHGGLYYRKGEKPPVNPSPDPTLKPKP